MLKTDYEEKINKVYDKYSEVRDLLDLAELKSQKQNLEKEMSGSDFWNNNERAKKVSKKLDNVKKKIKFIENMEEKLEEVEIYWELWQEDKDPDIEQEIEENLQKLDQSLDKMILQLRLNGEYDESNAILSIHPGAGGTESQDWAEMLLRMYTRWAEKEGYDIETLDLLPGDEAGIKSVTILIKGKYSYGYLKSERGVHRLVRISPFDSSGRRHTSFASVDVVPEFNDDIEIEVDENDLKIETYRASGAGGQHVNKTESAVRITHKPTGTVVQCQNERSQHKNKKMAMKVLKAKLFELKEEAQAEKIEELRGEHKEIAWGSQIRSYVFHPYNMIKDHRTNFEEGNVEKVMDGEIDQFIESYLKYNSQRS
ncbi:MAG: peptide chain release factor 2 [Halanaerobiaceae bacterium]